MEAKHTKGPWITKEQQVYAEDGDGFTLAHVYDPSRDHDHSEVAANARLIAAAPELLEALTALFNKIVENVNLTTPDLDAARAAIAKATGAAC